MANGVTVCQCGTILWNNASGVERTYQLLKERVAIDVGSLVRHERRHGRYISPYLARRRLTTLVKAKLARQQGDTYVLCESNQTA